MTKLIIAAAIAINLVAFAAMGIDKRKARRGSRRIPEAWLLGFALVGGAPGSWIGMFTFRHKTRKVSFLAKMLGVSLAVTALAWWLVERYWDRG